MVSLQDVLNQRTWRELRATAHAHRLPFNTHHGVVAARERLYTALTAPNIVKRKVAALTVPEREALQALQQAGGQMPIPLFGAVFGYIAPYRPWRVGAPKKPWNRPGTVAESLWYKAFIMADRTHIYLPAEVLACLPPLPAVKLAQSPRAPVGEAPPAGAAMADSILLLGLLMREDVKPIGGRWLPPAFLRRADAIFSVKDPTITHAQSELQTQRLRFIHYLLEVAELVSTQSGLLKPTPKAWAWLDSLPHAQRSILREAIQRDLQGKSCRWERYRLPPIGAAVWREVFALFADLDSMQEYELASLIGALRPRLPGQPLTGVPELLEGPLTWLGEVTAPTPDVFRPLRFNNMPTQPHPVTLEYSDNAISICIPTMGEGPAAARPLVELMAWVDATSLPAGIMLSIDMKSVQRAVAAHQTVTHLAAIIGRLIGKAVPQAVWAQLERWELASKGLILANHVILTSPDSDLLVQLRRDRHVRPLIRAALATHHLAVQPHHADELSRRLARRGYTVTDQRHPARTLQAGLISIQGDVDRATAAYLWLAVRVYQGMGRLADLPITIPGSILDAMTDQLGEGQHSLLEQSAKAVLEQIERVIANEALVNTPAPEQPDPVAVRHRVERAHAERRTLVIDYFSPAVGAITRRTIQPLMPIVRQGDHDYIEAWCQEAQAERTFRLDRIVRVVAEGSPTPHTP